MNANQKIFLAIAVFGILSDQIAKKAALVFLSGRPLYAGDFLGLEVYKNYGVAFGVPVSAGIFYPAVLIFLAALLYAWPARLAEAMAKRARLAASLADESSREAPAKPARLAEAMAKPARLAEAMAKRAGKISRVEAAAISLVFAGALSNTIDRVNSGYITDFISVNRLLFFNFADVFIVIGAVTLLLKNFGIKNLKLIKN